MKPLILTSSSGMSLMRSDLAEVVIPFMFRFVWGRGAGAKVDRTLTPSKRFRCEINDPENSMKRLILTTSHSGAGHLKTSRIADIVLDLDYRFVWGPWPSKIAPWQTRRPTADEQAAFYPMGTSGTPWAWNTIAGISEKSTVTKSD